MMQASVPLFQDIQPETIQPLILDLLDQNRKKLAVLLSYAGPFTWDNLMQPLEAMNDELHNAWSPFSHLHSVMENEASREVYNRCLPKLTAYYTELAQNETLYNAIASIAESEAYAGLDAAQRAVIDHEIRDFKLAGVNLPPDKKKEMARLQQQLSESTTQFSENILDATHAWILPIQNAEQLAGLPENAITLAKENAKQRGLNGYVITLDFPSYSTAMKFLHDRSLRETLYQAYVTRASDAGPQAGKWDNSPIMDAILKQRYDIARLAGFNNYAEYSLATKMAKNPETVIGFLQDLLEKTQVLAKKEMDELRAFAKKSDGLDSLEAWDFAYYSEKFQKSLFDFTQEDFRPYFPIQKVLTGLFTVVNKLYGLDIRKEEDVSVWHPDVSFFSIYDENQTLRGGFYIDLYARPNKRDGAWMDDCRARRKLNRDQIQYPIAFLTCNFMRPVGGKPALLTHDDVLTLFHEFGHGLHHMLTTVDHAPVSGINGVSWDAVELPSQFMENWCWESETLSFISGHYETGETLPVGLFQKLIDARHFQTGLQFVRQLELALFDFRLHLEYDPAVPNQIQSILDDVRKKTAVITVPRFNRFQHSFSHIFAGGYAAGYYSYKWAEVLSSDAFSQFEEKGLFDRSTGRAFLHAILEAGGVREPLECFISFQGREPKIDALLRHSGLINETA